MEISAKIPDPVTASVEMEKCSSEMKLTKSSKLFSIESIMANTNKDPSAPGTESPVTQESFYGPQNGSQYPLPLPLPPGSHYGNTYSNSWFGGLFNAHLANNLPDKDLPPFPGFNAYSSPDQPPTRAPFMFNDPPSAINAFQREKLAQYFMSSLRSAGSVPRECDKLTELLFRSSRGVYPSAPLFENFIGDQQSDKSRSPPLSQYQERGPTGLPEEGYERRQSLDQRHLSTAIIGCLPLMSKQIQGGSGEIHQQQQQQMMMSQDKSMMDTASNDSCSDDLSLTLSPGGESNTHRGE